MCIRDRPGIVRLAGRVLDGRIFDFERAAGEGLDNAEIVDGVAGVENEQASGRDIIDAGDANRIDDAARFVVHRQSTVAVAVADLTGAVDGVGVVQRAAAGCGDDLVGFARRAP